ncbi:acetyl-CoA carboxylase biotin carboxyl carrier protein [Tenacibaculum sp. SG-28]|uniref:acetyl-CoA carboxylase biotin carboxyl carrier protein n=1 Tax=Tenacibaculum sp. SG-28 TaxID=754426 RepID=UPI000CF4AFE8|nr:acetyl-CoA carboxylase biotin carboxyl carrier protein [Tenacibaculum sp. SG-28]PQJ21578.1 acetyl-CoA carboxylase, biotin carboxyl carrier protein [Tenacibaculum sp. SG-28]
MDIKEIQSLIKFVAKSGASEVKLEMDDLKITIKTGSTTPETTIIQAAAPVATPQQILAPAPVAPAATPVASPDAPAKDASADEDSKYITIKSPIIGTFYRKPSPDKPAFVEVGANVKTGDTVCVIEAMKLFNEIESEVSGKIVKVLVDDSSPVEFDQPLFLVDPS